MIRINLSPTKRVAKRAESDTKGQGWLVVVLGVLVAQMLVLFFVYRAKEDELGGVKRKNAEIQASVDGIKSQLADHAAVKAQLKELRDREEAIQKLQAARTGPTAVMLELARLLTTGRGPTVSQEKLDLLRRENPASLPSASWDARRLWLTGYSESERTVKIAGMARDGEDVSEFLRRLSLSDMFFDVKLLPAQKAADTTTKLELVKFDVSAKVRY